MSEKRFPGKRVVKTFFNSSKPFVQQPFGANKYRSDAKASDDMIQKMAKCNTLTICSSKVPEHYLKVIRFHFKNSSQDTLCL